MVKQLREGFKTLSKDLSAGKTEVSQEFADLYKKATGQDLILEDAYTMYQDPKAIERLTQAKGLDIGQAVTSDELRRMRALSALGGGGLQISQAAGDQANPLVGTDATTLRKEAFVNFLKNAQKDITGTGKSTWKKWDDLGITGKNITESATRSANIYNMLLQQMGLTPEPGKTVTPEEVASLVYGTAKPTGAVDQGLVEDKGITGRDVTKEGQAFIPTGGFEDPFAGRTDIVGQLGSAVYNIGNLPVSFVNDVLKVIGYDPAGKRAAKSKEAKGLAEERAAAALKSNVEKFLQTQGVGRKLTIKPTTPTGGQ
jgi:hypothetical protein